MRTSQAALAALLALGGCSKTTLVDADPAPRPDAGDELGCTDSALSVVDAVDILFVVDNSKSMAEEQQNLAAQLPRLASTLASGRLQGIDAEGKPFEMSFPAAKSIHLGVVTSDMGASGVEEIPGGDRTACGTAGTAMDTLGDDGVLLRDLDGLPGCTAGAGGAYLAFDAETDDAQDLGGPFACRALVGTDGCGFEQQLEAAWKALAPATDKSFSRGTGGHGNAENAGFLREDSVLAVVVVSDEDDCSIPDEARALFSPNDQNILLNVSCGLNPNSLHPVSRYVDGLRSLRPDNPDLVVFAAIAGVPLEAEGMLDASGTQDHAAILAMEAMQFRQDLPDQNGNILPKAACETSNGRAFPGRRFVEVAKQFGDNALVRSICSDDFSFAITSVSRAIAKKLGTPASTGAASSCD
jgi:hypothetical protein